MSGPVTTVNGEAVVISERTGQIRPGREYGFYVRDTRFLRELRLLVDGDEPIALQGGGLSPTSATFHGYVRGPVIDPTLVVIRRRTVVGSLREEVELRNYGAEPSPHTVELVCGTDFAYIFDVKDGRPQPQVSASPADGGLVFVLEGGPERTEVTPSEPATVDGGTLRFEVEVPPRGSVRLAFDVVTTDASGTMKPVEEAEPRPGVSPSWICSEARFTRLVAQGRADLDALSLTDDADPADRYYAAGSPWFLTLFGRDSIWAAYMALPFDPDIAASTLRVLARRQGQKVDLGTEEEPGKILHEIRRGGLADRGFLPPSYYGTVDATPLFVVLASEAWRWGMPAEEVEFLLPNIEAALSWMDDHGDVDGDGFLEYVQHGQRGLSNQGWKDSGDGIQFADGTLAAAPIALSEVQGYAYDAAMRGADLLDGFGRAGGDRWRTWAQTLAQRFRERFWIEDDDGPYPAVALDADKRPVDAVASNMGHLLMTGILDPAEAQCVAARLTDPSMSSGWGLRTMATTARGYNPLSYHGGSVWPHDTAIAVWGLATAGLGTEAHELIRDLVHAAPHFEYRLPELFGGLQREPGGHPVPYPTACSPQAWAAASGLLLVRSCLGIEVDVPGGRVVVRPPWPPVFGRLELRDLPVGGGSLDVVVDADAGIQADLRDADVEVVAEGP